MIGADKIDLSNIEGKQLINLDGFERNTIIIESASFFRYHTKKVNTF